MENTTLHGVSQETAEAIATQTCILEIHRHEPGFSRTVPSESILNGSTNNNIDPKRLTVYKALITNKELRDLNAQRASFFDEIKAMSLPGGLLVLGGGQYLVPLSNIGYLKQRLDAYLEERNVLLDDFEARYPDIVKAAEERLGKLFSAGDYPPFAHIRSLYRTTYKFISNAVPEELAKVSQALYDAEKARIIADCHATAGLIQEALRSQFLDLVDHLHDRLKPDEETGKKKRFHGSNLSHLQGFISQFKNLNLTDDSQLESLVKQSESLISNLDPDQIRTDEAIRESLEKGFNDLKNAADSLVITEARRVILED